MSFAEKIIGYKNFCKNNNLPYSDGNYCPSIQRDGSVITVTLYDPKSIYHGAVTDRYILKNGKIDGIKESWRLSVPEDPSLERKLHKRSMYKDGLKEGTEKTWFKDGGLSSFVEYKNNLVHGESKSWYNSGQLYMRTFYTKGKENGLREIYHSNGYLALRVHVIDGKEYKLFEKWNPNGGNIMKCSMKNGIKHGLSRWWSRNLPMRPRNYYLKEIYMYGVKIYSVMYTNGNEIDRYSTEYNNILREIRCLKKFLKLPKDIVQLCVSYLEPDI